MAATRCRVEWHHKLQRLRVILLLPHGSVLYPAPASVLVPLKPVPLELPPS